MNQIEEHSYVINEYKKENFTVFGTKYDYRMAICVGDCAFENIKRIPSSSPKTPKCTLSYQDTSKLDIHLKYLTPHSKLILLLHGGGLLKPDFSWKNVADLLVCSAPQLLDPADEVPSTLFKISLVSCRALKYGLDLSQALAKGGISNRITARAFNVFYDLTGRKMTCLEKQKFHKKTGSKILFTTYAQHPGLSQVEIVNYEGGLSDGFVCVPTSEKPIQNWKIDHHSSESYEAILRVIEMLGLEKIPFCVLCEAVANHVSPDILKKLSKYFTKMLSDVDYLEQLVKYLVKKGVNSIVLDDFFKNCDLSIPGKADSWVRFAIRYRIPTTILEILLSRHCEEYRKKQEKNKLFGFDYHYLDSYTLIHVLEKQATEVLSLILPYFASKQISSVIEWAAENGYSEEMINKLLTPKRDIRLAYKILDRIPKSPATLNLQKLLIPYVYNIPRIRLRRLSTPRNPELEALISQRLHELQELESRVEISKTRSYHFF